MCVRDEYTYIEKIILFIEREYDFQHGFVIKKFLETRVDQFRNHQSVEAEIIRRGLWQMY